MREHQLKQYYYNVLRSMKLCGFQYCLILVDMEGLLNNQTLQIKLGFLNMFHHRSLHIHSCQAIYLRIQLYYKEHLTY
jgi:hypothetical protein